MMKILLPIYTFLLITFFAAINFSQTPQNTKNIIEGIVLDKNQIESAPCPSYSQDSDTTIVSFIKVDTKVQSKEFLQYEYIVSGGNISGIGKKVTWDLSNVSPGTYTITVNIKGDTDFRKTFTTKVDVLGCYIIDCLECPDLSIERMPKSFKVGDKIKFVASVTGMPSSEIGYKWEVSGGKIIKGQGTHRIIVKVQKSPKNSITAKIEISGACSECAAETTTKTLTVDYKK